MKKIAVASLVVALLAAASVRGAEDAPRSGPEKEHEWLQQFVGEWEAQLEAPSEPGTPSVKATERVRTIGGLWIVAEGEVSVASEPIRSLFTLGYGPEKEKFVGTWIDSRSSFLWTYQGTLDAAGKTLTLETEGPGHQGGLSKYKDVIELKDKDHKLLTSSVQDGDGEWSVFAKVSYRRTK